MKYSRKFQNFTFNFTGTVIRALNKTTNERMKGLWKKKICYWNIWKFLFGDYFFLLLLHYLGRRRFFLFLCFVSILTLWETKLKHILRESLFCSAQSHKCLIAMSGLSLIWTLFSWKLYGQPFHHISFIKTIIPLLGIQNCSGVITFGQFEYVRCVVTI